MKTVHFLLVYIVAPILVCIFIFIIPLFSQGNRSITPLENIYGIPFVAINDTIHITENLAHADISLQEPVLAKQLTLNISFKPGTARSILVGVRENSFWLSYTPVVVYSASEKQQLAESVITKKITIPLTDKLQEPDRSIDLMFFTEPVSKTEWELISLKATVQSVVPNYTQLKDYIKSILKQERAV